MITGTKKDYLYVPGIEKKSEKLKLQTKVLSKDIILRAFRKSEAAVYWCLITTDIM